MYSPGGELTLVSTLILVEESNLTSTKASSPHFNDVAPLTEENLIVPDVSCAVIRSGAMMMRRARRRRMAVVVGVLVVDDVGGLVVVAPLSQYGSHWGGLVLIPNAVAWICLLGWWLGTGVSWGN